MIYLNLMPCLFAGYGQKLEVKQYKDGEFYLFVGLKDIKSENRDCLALLYTMLKQICSFLELEMIFIVESFSPADLTDNNALTIIYKLWGEGYNYYAYFKKNTNRF